MHELVAVEQVRGEDGEAVLRFLGLTVDADDTLTRVQQGTDEMAADESGRTRDDRRHPFLLTSAAGIHPYERLLRLA